MKKEKQSARKIQKTIYLDAELIDCIDKYTIDKERSFTWLVEQAIKKFVKSKSIIMV